MIYQTKKLGEVLEKVQKLSGILTKEYAENGTYPIIDQGQSVIAGYTENFDSVYTGELPVIIFGDHTRAIKFVDFRFAVGADGTKILRPIPELCPKYFYYFLQSVQLPARGYTRHFKLLKELEISVPSIEEQKKIVAKIEKSFAKINETARLRSEALAATEQILPAALHEIFQEGKKNGWNKQMLGEICEIARGGSPRPIKEYLTDADDGINWVKISDASSSTKYIYETKEKIKKDGLKKTRIVKPGDFILTNSMSFGRPYIMKTSGAIHDGWLLLRPKKELLEEYMYYFLSSDEIYQQFSQLAGGAVVQNLNSELVRSVEIFIPTLAEQKKIVKKLDALSEKVAALRELQLAQQTDLADLKQSILHEAFSGSIKS